MPIEYAVRFQPGRFHVVPAQSQGPAGTLPFFYIVDDKSGRQIGFAVERNDAQTLCLSLEILSAMLEDDRTRFRDLAKLVDALKKGTLQ